VGSISEFAAGAEVGYATLNSELSDMEGLDEPESGVPMRRISQSADRTLTVIL